MNEIVESVFLECLGMKNFLVRKISFTCNISTSESVMCYRLRLDIFWGFFSPVLANLLLIKLLFNFVTVFPFFSLSIHFFWIHNFLFSHLIDWMKWVILLSWFKLWYSTPVYTHFLPIPPKSTPAHIHFWLWNHPRPLQKARTPIFTPPPHLILATKPIFPACVISPSSR